MKCKCCHAELREVVFSVKSEGLVWSVTAAIPQELWKSHVNGQIAELFKNLKEYKYEANQCQRVNDEPRMSKETWPSLWRTPGA